MLPGSGEGAHDVRYNDMHWSARDLVSSQESFY